jgi:hypothetical protein
MSDLGWRADGIERALAAGGVPLETYRKVGFTGGVGVRRSDMNCYASGFQVHADPEPDDYRDRSGRKRQR